MSDDFDPGFGDEAVSEPKYGWDRRYQQEIVGMMLHDRVFLTQSIQVVKPNYFYEQAHETIAEQLINYFDAYKQVPARFVLVELIKTKIQDETSRVKCLKELNACMQAWVPGQETREHCLDRVTEFAKEQSLRLAVLKTIDLMKKRPRPADCWTQIETMLKEAILVDRNYDMGQDYFDDLDARYDRLNEELKEVEVFSTGFPEIDCLISRQGLKRGEIGAFMGLSGTGKSVMLVKAAVRNILAGKKVLYVTLEMSQDGIASRFDSQFARERMSNLLSSRAKVISACREVVSDSNDKRQLVIKQFPAGSLDMSGLRAYLSQCHLAGFVPDLVCLDYVGELKDYEGLKVYESRQRLVRELRGLAMEEDICILTALQANRTGRQQVKENGIMDDDALGDSYGQARPLDLLVSINMSQQDKAAGVGQLYVVKNRDGESRKAIYIKTVNECLDYVAIDLQQYSMLRGRVQEQMAQDTEGRLSRIMSNKKHGDTPENS